MAHAWLDSLSEDWVSEPRSPAGSLPSLPSTGSIAQPKDHPNASRIPVFRPRKSSQLSSSRIDGIPLSERSPNEHNVLQTKNSRRSSKLRDELSSSPRGLSDSTQSVQHHTVQHRSQSSSPHKSRGDTPEWRRRLLNGDVGYGDQCELFGKNGLENIFRPPVDDSSPVRPTAGIFARSASVVMPSSPPIYNPTTEQDHEASDEPLPSKNTMPRQMQYRLQRSSSDPSQLSSDGSILNMSSRLPSSDHAPSEQAPNVRKAPSERTTSGGSAMVNENFSPIFLSRLNTIAGRVASGRHGLAASDLERRLKELGIDNDLGTDTSQVSGSLRGYSTVRTEDLRSFGDFVNVRRGGRSTDGSFRHRMLSPSSLPPIGESSLAETDTTAQEIPQEPAVLPPSPNSADARAAVSPPQTPNRPQSDRVEAKSSGGSPLKLFGPYDTFTDQKLRRRLSQFEMEPEEETFAGKGSMTASTHASRTRRSSTKSMRPRSARSQDLNASLGRFGEGQFDDFKFSDDVSVASNTAPDATKKQSEAEPTTFAFDRSVSDMSGASSFRRRRVSSKRQGHHDTPKSTSSRRVSSEKTPRKSNDDHSIKRLQKSPTKKPTPKRRRTLQKNEIADMELTYEIAESLHEKHMQIQSVIGRKRKDAKYDSSQTVANPNVIAMRQILKPRSASMHPRQIPAHHSSEIMSELDERAMIDAEVARAIAERSQLTDGASESRKGSVTTQDFLDEAKKIMANIRSKARSQPPSGLASIGESDPDGGDPDQDGESSWAESSIEPLSRPPSRENGGPLARLPRMQADPKLLNHLKKYEEKGELDDAIVSSLRSLDLVRDNIKNVPFNGKAEREEAHEILESDPPNIRITQTQLQRKRRHSTSSTHGPDDTNFNSLAGLTTRSIPTSSSKSSESRRVIAPQAVEHLIPEKLAGMVFDKDRKTWVKAEGRAVADDKDDDPFGDIPDLNFDAAEELEQLIASSPKRKASYDLDIDSRPQSPGDDELGQTMPQSSELAASDCEDEADLQSEIDVAYHVERADEDIDEEIFINDRIQPHSDAFSSPAPTIDREREPSQDVGGDTDDADIPRGARAKMRMFSQNTPSRRMTIGGCSFHARPVSRIDEEDEDVVDRINLEYARRSVSLVISTPVPNRQELTLVPHSSVERPAFSSLLNLTPLSEFTLHKRDPALVLEASYAGPVPLEARGDSSKSLNLTIKELVKQLTDVEPHEPFWEHLRHLELRRRGLSSVHMLAQFCGQLEELDIAHNQIDQLTDAPSTIRCLSISHNHINDLTSWGHLRNLQYVDVSNNELRSLRGFKDMIHLRSLRAENNHITTLDGVLDLDGLLSLKLRGNKLTQVNFAKSQLQRLSELDLKDNQIQEIRCISELTALSTLNLEGNDLRSFVLGGTERMTMLRYLKLSGNRLTEIDVSRFNNLRLLYLDGNCLTTVKGFQKTKYLDSLSLREQQGSDTLDLSFLTSACEVRKLFLSGNHIAEFNPTVDFLNLQYLEMANCGLERLPEEFGQIMSNVRVLNLNFNALKDITPLYGIIRLKKLYLAGNRLGALHSTADTLRRIPNLAKADLRMNPLTIGFYPPVVERRVVRVGDDDSDEVTINKFVLPSGDPAADAAYTSRLDMETRLRRRVYEMMLSGCKALRALDGLQLDASALMAQDKVWEALAKEGIVDAIFGARPDSDEE